RAAAGTLHTMAESSAGSTVGRAFGTAAVVAGGLVLATAGLAAWATTRVARTVITPVRRRPQNQTIRGFDETLGTVTLRQTPDASMPGRFGMW
ncbi:hypothetical protein SB782_33550, partial [Brevibacillus sp. SIMBA_076]